MLYLITQLTFKNCQKLLLCPVLMFIQASLSKIQGLLKDLPAVFKDYKVMKNVDLHNEILLQEC